MKRPKSDGVGAFAVHESVAQGVSACLGHCLRSPLVRRWCLAEWFYSNVDQPFFAHNEFLAHVDSLGLSQAAAQGLTRAEWATIRLRLGRPRRLSPAFLRQERERLFAYRTAIATMRRTGSLDDAALVVLRNVRLPPPLAARQRVVVADFPRARLRTGSIMARTVDCAGYMVRFDDKNADDMLIAAHDIMPYGDSASIVQQQRFAYAPIQSSLTRSLGKVVLPSQAEAAAAAAAASTSTAVGALAGGGAGAAATLVGAGEAAVAHSAETVRSLAQLLYLLRRKELLLHELRHMNDLAELAVADQQIENEHLTSSEQEPIEFDVRFRHEYAWLLAQVKQTDTLLAEALKSLETHPMRQRTGGKTRAANQSSWYAPLGAACAGHARDVVHQAIDRNRKTDADFVKPEKSVTELVEAAVSLLLHVVYCCENAMPQNETTLALFAASTALRPHIAANQSVFTRIEEQLNRFKRAAFTAPLQHQQQQQQQQQSQQSQQSQQPPQQLPQPPSAQAPMSNMMMSPPPVPKRKVSALH